MRDDAGLSWLPVATHIPRAYAIAFRAREIELDDIAHTQGADSGVSRVDELALVVVHTRRERPRVGLASRHHELAFAATAPTRYPIARLEGKRGSGVSGKAEILRRGLARIAAR